MNHILSEVSSRIRNALAVGHSQVEIPQTKMTTTVGHILTNEGYLDGYDIGENKNLIYYFRCIEQDTNTYDKYYRNVYEKKPSLTSLKIISKPSLRVYTQAKDASYGNANGQTLGLTILSTNKGVMTERDAKLANVGGEVLCTVW